MVDGTFAFFHTMLCSCQGSRGISAGKLQECCPVQDTYSQCHQLNSRGKYQGLERAPVLRSAFFPCW